MDNITELANIEGDAPEFEINLGKEIAKALVISTATTVGFAAGLVVFVTAMNKIDNIKKRRAEKKAAKIKSETPENES